jgi:hypothetical protein
VNTDPAHPAIITEPGRDTPVYAEFDVVVVGGGPAGLMAAAAAGPRRCVGDPAGTLWLPRRRGHGRRGSYVLIARLLAA